MEGQNLKIGVEGKSSLSLNDSFSFEEFEQKWKRADRQLKQEMIRFAGVLDIENGLGPVILGLKDYILSIREEAKKALQAAIQISKNFKGAEHAQQMLEKMK